MGNVASSPDQRLVESHLRQLSGLDRLRRLLADLNYQVSDDPVSAGGWKSELAVAAKEGNLRIVARHDHFVVSCCRLPELTLTPEGEIVTRLVRQYDRGLFLFADHLGGASTRYLPSSSSTVLCLCLHEGRPTLVGGTL